MFDEKRKRRLLLLGERQDTDLNELDDSSKLESNRASVDPDRVVDAAIVPRVRETADAFLASCRVSEPPTLLLDDGTTERRIAVEQPYVVVGRSENCSLQLDEKDVSYRHAYLQFVGGRLLCFDLESRKGVHWPEGARPVGWFDRDAVLRIGTHRLRWTSSAFTDEEPDDRVVQLHLSMQDGSPTSKRRTSCLLRGRIAFVGRDSTCRVRLIDKSVSVFHASFVLTPSGAWVVDLVGRGGVVVNGERVDCAALSDGDTVQFGRFRFTVWLTAGVDVASTPYVAGVDLQPPPRQLAHRTTTAARLHSTNGENDPASKLELRKLVEYVAGIKETMVTESRSQLASIAEMFAQMNANLRTLLRDEFGRINAVNDELRELYGSLAADRSRFADSELPSSELPSSELPSSELPSSELPSSELPSSELPSSELPSSELPSSDANNSNRDVRPRSDVPWLGDAPDRSAIRDQLVGARPSFIDEDDSASDERWRILQRINQLEQERTTIWDRIGTFLGAGP